MRDLAVGAHVMCYEGGPDMMTPAQATWCPVVNFARADEQLFSDMICINFTGASNTPGSITVSATHAVHLLTGPVKSPEAVANIDDLGPAQIDLAMNAQPGQALVVPTSNSNTTGYTAGIIQSVEQLTAMGKYQPAIEHPFILVDGAVMPLWTVFPNTNFVETTSSYGRYQQALALKHMFMAPLWMTRVQPLGTPGIKATWDCNPRAPLVRALDGWMQVSGAANFTRAFEWFKPRYEAWKADPRDAITEVEVVAAWPQMFDGQEATGAARVSPSVAPMLGTLSDVLDGMASGACSAASACSFA